MIQEKIQPVDIREIDMNALEWTINETEQSKDEILMDKNNLKQSVFKRSASEKAKFLERKFGKKGSDVKTNDDKNEVGAHTKYLDSKNKKGLEDD